MQALHLKTVNRLIDWFFNPLWGFLRTVNNWFIYFSRLLEAFWRQWTIDFFYFSRLFEAFWRQWIDRSRLSEDVSSFIFILYYIFEDVSEMVLKKGHTFWFVLVNCPTHQPTCFAHSHLITNPKWDIWQKQSRATSKVCTTPITIRGRCIKKNTIGDGGSTAL